MPQPKKLIPHCNKTIRLPVESVLKVELHLIDQIEGKVPHGKWQEFFVRLIEDYFSKSKLTDEQYLYNRIAELTYSLSLIDDEDKDRQAVKVQLINQLHLLQKLLKSFYKDKLNEPPGLYQSTEIV